MKTKDKTKRRAAYLRSIVGHHKFLERVIERGQRLVGTMTIHNLNHPIHKQLRRSVMGYRSDVGMLIVGKDEESFGKFCAQLKLWALAECDGKLFSGWEPECWGYNNKSIGFFTQSVKWYPDYPEVKSAEALWEFAEQYEQYANVLSGTFIRIGEEGNDIEERCFGIDPPWEEMKLVRYIEVNELRVPLNTRKNEVLGTQEETEETE